MDPGILGLGTEVNGGFHASTALPLLMDALLSIESEV
jgi:hypothetical protein